MFRISINDKIFSCSENNNLLKAARSQMVKVPYGCASGGCGMCKVKVLHGDYRMDMYSKQALTNRERENHKILLCKTYPLSHLEIDLMKERVK